ncbi:polyphosphate polymerase domain-containing protein [Oscillospiraceae bacterium MB08-C2-2]|nr:polyphosphate polymerase domain-containing protein [Oscillospiraceae bacterium MB08-C2-2]
MKARHEFKHSLNYMDYIILRNKLRAILPHDDNVDANGEYKIRSLYFDTPGDKALLEKLNGFNRREKFRLRRYNDDTQFVRLEKKSKISGLCYKQSASLSREEVKLLLQGQWDWMIQQERPLVAELYSKMNGQLLQPKTIVDYVREPFIYPAGNVRITFDRDIRTGLQSKAFLDNDLPTVPAGNEIVLLEVKYDEFIPGFIADLLQLGNRKASACSKYALCRIYG